MWLASHGEEEKEERSSNWSTRPFCLDRPGRLVGWRRWEPSGFYDVEYTGYSLHTVYSLQVVVITSVCTLQSRADI